MIAWLDCSAGIAGDMLLGALLDAGASLEVVRRAVQAVHPGLEVTVEATSRHSLAATKARIIDTASGHEADHHDHEHGHGHGHPHRPYREVCSMLDAAELDPGVRTLAHSAFAALARAEGAVHGIDPADVEFHEVGSLDAIGDIVGCAAAYVDLGITELHVSPVTVGHGEQVWGAHGRIPIPGPAVTHLARHRGIPISGGPCAMEMATPTGVAMLAAWASAFGPMPALIVERAGMGAGTRDPQAVANVVRVLVGSGSAEGDQAIVLETNVDDLDPRVWPGVLEALLAAGAQDAWLTPILMKKGRPAHTLSVLATAGQREALVEIIARQTTSLGVREVSVTKHVLGRRMESIEVAGQPVAIKLGLWRGEVVNAQPEYADCAAVAETTGMPVKEVIARAESAWWARLGE